MTADRIEIVTEALEAAFAQAEDAMTPREIAEIAVRALDGKQATQQTATSSGCNRPG